MDINEKISKLIKTLRIQRKMTVADLAYLARVSVYTIYRIEDHRGIPRIETLDMIFHALDYKFTIGGSPDEIRRPQW